MVSPVGVTIQVLESATFFVIFARVFIYLVQISLYIWYYMSGKRFLMEPDGMRTIGWLSGNKMVW